MRLLSAVLLAVLLAMPLVAEEQTQKITFISLCGKEAKKELRAEIVKLYVEHPVPYNVQVHVLEPEVLGLYIQEVPAGLRFIFIMPRLSGKRQAEVLRHEWCHMLQEASGRGVKMTREEREKEAKAAEDGKFPKATSSD